MRQVAKCECARWLNSLRPNNTYNINLSDQERKMMEAWDKQDPIDEWEIEKNRKIEKIK